ncbi:hypothetical protein EAH_00012650 [Eimeria acervulina]|uniref:Secreted protein n=1 Tax=Eimeria acervulina TaxID=5801 RepID=U6GUP2_EIMAC|nr:hypothetical protein EAH_00012650 [Eimeria acervulina]CDI83981.1 hypothetical protein EAH_00012650 [Eimeria acervulina]
MSIACILFNFLFFSWLLSSTTLPKVAAAAAAAADAATGGFEALNEEEITKEISFAGYPRVSYCSEAPGLPSPFELNQLGSHPVTPLNFSLFGMCPGETR